MWGGEERVLPLDYNVHFWQHVGRLKRRNSCITWRAIWMAVVWTLWLHRNAIIFRQETSNLDHIIDPIKFRA